MELQGGQSSPTNTVTQQKVRAQATLILEWMLNRHDVYTEDGAEPKGGNEPEEGKWYKE